MRTIRICCGRIMTLLDLPLGARGTVVDVHDATAADAIARRLRELGFVAGEAVRVLTVAPFGADPLLVEIGATRFALRRAEAARVTVTV